MSVVPDLLFGRCTEETKYDLIKTGNDSHMGHTNWNISPNMIQTSPLHVLSALNCILYFFFLAWEAFWGREYGKTVLGGCDGFLWKFGSFNTLSNVSAQINLFSGMSLGEEGYGLAARTLLNYNKIYTWHHFKIWSSHACQVKGLLKGKHFIGPTILLNIFEGWIFLNYQIGSWNWTYLSYTLYPFIYT